MTNDLNILERAYHACDALVTYALGKGGYDPGARTPADANGLADCSGFVAWAIGRDRRPSTSWRWWFSTDSIVSDAKNHGILFDLVEKSEIKPGDVIAYPDYRRGSRLRQGHTAIITGVSWDNSGNPTIEIIDCSSSQSERTGQAIHERNGDFFLRKTSTIICRYKHHVDPLPKQRDE